MRHHAFGLLPNLAVALVLCGCGSLDPQPEPASAGVVLSTASADAGVEPSPETRPKDRLSSFDLLVYGFSYHTDRETAHRDQVDNEFNWGLGVNYEFRNTDKDVAFVGGGFYRDSGRNLATAAGPGYQLKFGERWRLGAGFMFVKSPTYNKGRLLFAPIPLLTYDFGAVKLNGFYAPRFQQYNNVGVLGLYFGIPLKCF